MSRTSLYSEFENFDKPDELDFRELIDFAGYPNSVEEVTLTPSNNILDDMNAVTWIMTVRRIFVITYGADIYLFTAIEGTYGSGGILIQAGMYAKVGSKSSTLTTTLTADISVGGISSGDSFSAGTPIENVLQALLTTNSVSSLGYVANAAGQYLEVGTQLDITKFTWSSVGSPTNMVLTDSEGFSTPVTGVEHIVSRSYTKNSFSSVLWTLNGSNINPTTKRTYWVERTYYGQNLSGTTPTEAQILAGSSVLSLTSTGITLPLNTSDTQFGWIAVEQTQTGSDYTDWRVTELNKGLIGAGEFIKAPVVVSVNGKNYKVYVFSYASSLNNITLE